MKPDWPRTGPQPPLHKMEWLRTRAGQVKPFCSCGGWRGPLRDRLTDATVDYVEHVHAATKAAAK
jgi:hypothetical protein